MKANIVRGLIAAFVVAASVQMGRCISSDADTLFLLHFENSLDGDGGQAPVSASGVVYEPGQAGQAAFFTPSNQVLYASSGNINATNGTLEFWIRPRWAGGDGQTHAFFAYGGGGGLYFAKDGGNWLKMLANRFAANGAPEVGVSIYVASEWASNQWHHVAYTWTTELLQLFVDGVLRSQSSITNLPAISATTFQLGAEGTDTYADGLLDELRVSNRARTAAEIQQDFQSDLPPLAPGISSQPKDVAQVTSATAAFSVGTSNLGVFLYQWQFNNTNLTDTARISGSQSNYLSISNLAFTDAGSYRVIVTNSSGSATSVVATLAVSPRTIKYSLVDLGILVAPYTNYAAAEGMSTNGQIVLEGYDENYQTHDFLWTNGVIIDLGYPSPTLTNFTFEWGMNSAGMIVGNAGGPDGTRAYLYASGHMNDLGILDAPYDAYSTAACVSDTGQIVGLSSDSDGNSHVFIYRAGQMTDLETLGHDKCEPNGINSQGTITGIAYDNNQGFAFVYSNDTATVIGTLPPPYDAYSAGRAINDLGWVTGNSWDTDGIAHAFLFASNSVTDLGSLAFPFDAQTTSIAMNNRGQIVGVGISPDSRGRALVYENGRIDDLNNLVDPTLGWRLIQAQAINDYGQIVGYGKINEAAQDHSFLLNPLAAHSLTVLAAGNGSMTISVSNVLPAETVVLQSSTALTAWSAVATNIADGSTTSFTISIEHTSAARFFRAVVR